MRFYSTPASTDMRLRRHGVGTPSPDPETQPTLPFPIFASRGEIELLADRDDYPVLGSEASDIELHNAVSGWKRRQRHVNLIQSRTDQPREADGRRLSADRRGDRTH